MEALSLAIGIVLMLVAALGIVFYVALVIAIPICRLLDLIFGPEPDGHAVKKQASPDRSRRIATIVDRLTGRAAPRPDPEAEDA